MNRQRASEIIRSAGVVHVCYNGLPVWLENLGDENVEVTFIGLNQKYNVPISALAETDPLHSF